MRRLAAALACHGMRLALRCSLDVAAFRLECSIRRAKAVPRLRANLIEPVCLASLARVLHRWRSHLAKYSISIAELCQFLLDYLAYFGHPAERKRLLARTQFLVHARKRNQPGSCAEDGPRSQQGWRQMKSWHSTAPAAGFGRDCFCANEPPGGSLACGLCLQ